MITRILLVLIYVQNSMTMPHLALIQLMHVIKWLQSDSDSSCVNKNVHGNKRFYNITICIFLKILKLNLKLIIASYRLQQVKRDHLDMRFPSFDKCSYLDIKANPTEIRDAELTHLY